MEASLDKNVGGVASAREREIRSRAVQDLKEAHLKIPYPMAK
jgi:hypothetical protein